MDWYHFFIFLYRASQHLSFGTGGRREVSVGREIIGRVVDAAPGRPVLRSPNLVAAQPRLLLLFIRRAVAGRVTPARKLLEFPPAARPQVTVSPPALLPPPPPECLMLHKGEAVARSRPRPPTLLVQLA